MRILQLIQKNQFRGVEIFTLQLSKKLAESGNEVYVVSVFNEGNALLNYDNIQTLKGSKDLRFFDVKAWRNLYKIIKDLKPDLIQANSSDTLKYAVFSKILFNWSQPIVFRNASIMSGYINSNIKYFFNKWLLSFVSFIISVSNKSRQDIISTFSIDPKKVAVATIGIDCGEVDELKPDINHLFKMRPVILHVGGFVWEKNHSGVVRIFSDIKRNERDAQLFLIGQGAMPIEVQKIIAELDLVKSVHFLGVRDDVLEIMKKSDLFILPSLVEGLPAVILEAMYCKLPVVAYDVGGISEIVEDNVNGRLISKGDEKFFSEVALEMLKSPVRKETFVNNGYDLVLSQYCNNKIALNFLAIYKKVLGAD